MYQYGARSRIANMMLEKIKNDEKLNGLNQTKWYTIDDLYHYNMFSDRFVPLSLDDETRQFIDACYTKSEYFFTQIVQSMLLSLLKWFMPSTSINGLLQRGSMFVFSMQQFRMLIDFDHSPVPGGGGNGLAKRNSLLDLGAGDGAVTLKMAPFFHTTYATEMSSTMRWRLQQKGFKVVDVDAWDTIETSHAGVDGKPEFLKFDVISCLNLLDRCEKPLTLLRQIKGALVSGGLLVVALVLPYKPYVEYNSDKKPREQLIEPLVMEEFTAFSRLQHQQHMYSPLDQQQQQQQQLEQHCYKQAPGALHSQLNYLVLKLFKPLGFELVKFSKCPYLCEGGIAQSYYYLNDYIFVFKSV